MKTKIDSIEVVMFIALVVMFGIQFFMITPQYKEMRENYLLEKAEHEVDTMTVMDGVYENGFIVTEDGNEWYYFAEKPQPTGTEVTVIFQTDNKPKKEWKIEAVTQKVR